MKVKTRLTVGFLVIVSLIWVTVFFSGNTYRRIHEEFEVLKEYVVPTTILLIEMEKAAHETNHQSTEYVLYGEEVNRQRALSAMEHLEDMGLEHAEYMKRMGQMGEEAQVAGKELLVKIDALNSAVLETVDLKSQGVSTDELLKRDGETIHPVFIALIGQLEEHKAAHMEELALAEEAVEEAHTSGVQVLFLAAGLITLLATGVRFFAIKSIVNPLQALHKGTEIIGQGNLDYRVGTKARDEIGQLSRAFDQMTENLGRTTTSIDNLNREITERKRAEEALQESEARYRSLVEAGEHVGEAIIMLQDTDKVEAAHVFASQEWARITGYSIEELKGISYFDLIHPQHRNAVADRVRRRHMGESVPGLFEISIITKDGREVPVEVAASGGSITYQGRLTSVGYVRDITERKKLEHTLHERVKELQCLYGIADIAERPDITLDRVYQETTKLLSISWQYPEITCAKIVTDGNEFKTENYRETEWKQSSDIKVHREKVGIVEVGYLEEKPEIDEGPFLKEERLLIEAVAERLGRITERKRAEEEIRKFKTIADNSRNGVGISTIEGEFIYVNESYTRMHGYTIDEVIGEHYSIFYTEEQWKAVGRLRKQVLQKGSFVAEEVWHRRKDGTVFPTLMTTVLMRDDEGKPLYLSSITVDITERKRWERELQEKNEQLDAQNEKLQSQSEELMSQGQELMDKTKELEEANVHLQEVDHLKSIFLASMSHELRTPLNSIIGFSSLILQGKVGEINEEQRNQLTYVNSSANHLLSLINDILDISKIEAGEIELELEEFRLGDVATEVVETLSPIAKLKGIRLLMDISEDTKLFSDKRRLKQVLLNLVSNAVKFTDWGSVKIASRIPADDNLEISVIDTGIGIKKVDIGKLFAPFQQVDESLTKKHAGTGLGLYISRKIVTLLGGNISVKSEYSKGSEFTFTIPIHYVKEQRNAQSISSG